jgi:hypothetical protein
VEVARTIWLPPGLSGGTSQRIVTVAETPSLPRASAARSGSRLMASCRRRVGTRTSGDAVFGHHNSRRRIVGGRRRKAGRNRVRAAPTPPGHSRERLAVSRVLWL